MERPPSRFRAVSMAHGAGELDARAVPSAESVQGEVLPIHQRVVPSVRRMERMADF